MNLKGKMISNRYEIKEEVGNGGMAIVYKANDHVLNRNVAVKVLKDEYTTDPDFIKRFNTEAQSAAGLTHANIVSIYDVGHEEESNLYYIVMELVKGKTLKEIIRKDGALSWKWSVNIAMQIASALEAAHKNGIIHRDIKPHNIIITENGTAKVTDFGIAKVVSNSTMTSFGTAIGSVHYISPEQAKGSLTDAKSDIYSLGVVMYEMLTGRVPFDADTSVSIALKHMQEEPKEPIAIKKDIPTAVNQIVMKAMQKDPLDRYQSATEMIADLTKAIKDPNGDFVIIENKDGGYTRVMNAVKDENGKKNKKKQNIFKRYPKLKIPAFILGLIILFIIIFFGTRIIMDGGIKGDVQIPNLVGLSLDEAQQKLNEAKLNIVIGEPQASSTVAEGKVISQEPAYKDNQKIRERSAIKIILSKGPETTELPKFIGVKIDDARETAKKMGLVLKESTENSDTVQEGYIISQGTEEKTLVKSGDEVSVVVSSGVKKTKVPTVVGMDEGNAVATLANANLKAKITYISDETQANQRVVSQNIEKDKEVAENTTVELTINKFEKNKKTVKLKLQVTNEIIPKVDTKKETANTTEENVSGGKVSDPTINVTVNGNISLTDRVCKIGETVDCGTITGTESESFTVKVQVNGKTMIVDNFDLKDMMDGGNKFLKNE